MSDLAGASLLIRSSDGTFKEYPAFQGKSAYQSYLDTTTDLPKLTEKEWVESLRDTGSGIAPNNVSNFNILEEDSKITLKWSDPSDTTVDNQLLSTWAGTKLVRKVGSYPIDERDGTLVVDNRVRNGYNVNGFIDTGLVNGTIYYYQLFPYSDSNAVNKNTLNRISAIPMQNKVMTVNIDLSNSNPATCCSYADDATSMIAGSSDWDTFFGHKPCLFKNGAVVCYLNPNDFTKDVDGNSVDITSGDAGDVMIEFPRRGLTITTVGNIITIKMTNRSNDLNFEYNAHTRGDVKKNNIYIGAYKGYSLNSKLRSLSGKIPTGNLTIDGFRSIAQANGQGYEQRTFYSITFMQCMYILKYKHLNSQNTIGMGYVKTTNTTFAVTGGTNNYGMDCQLIRASNLMYMTDQLHQVKLFGIEDAWGNINEWLDGLYSDAYRNMLVANDLFNNIGGYTNIGSGAATDRGSYINSVQGTTKGGFIAKVTGGSSTTYFCDSAELYASKYGMFGGSHTHELTAGIFTVRLYYSSTTSTTYGARLMYL